MEGFRGRAFELQGSARLTHSLTCLVVGEHEYNPGAGAFLATQQRGHSHDNGPTRIEPCHALLSRLRERYLDNQEHPVLKNATVLLFGLALLAQASELPDPVQFNHAASELLAHALSC